ncbi:hypothetical protein HDV05_005963, partial [Chytridiales sp. JEL 0842]
MAESLLAGIGSLDDDIQMDPLETLRMLEELDNLPPVDPSTIPPKRQIPFTFFSTGRAGDVQVVPSLQEQRKQGMPYHISDMPFGLGPFEDEDIKAEMEDRFLKPKPYFHSDLLKRSQRMWYEKPNYAKYFQVDAVNVRATVVQKRNALTGEINHDDYEEVFENSMDQTSSASATSMKRTPGLYRNFVRGTSSGIPFAPGGLESVALNDGKDPKDVDLDALLSLDEDGLRTVPPGFERGMIFEDMQDVMNKADGKQTSLNIQDILLGENDDFDFLASISTEKGETKEESTAEDNADNNGPTEESDGTIDEVDEILPKESLLPSIVQEKKPAKQVTHREWAHVIDVSQPFPDFSDKVPELAHEYPFELDLFQKRAVYHLEQNDSVFVAAHTSAGKTVVAEYAIALAQKHMTKAIYTSPIKALSNQKFRDFRVTFEDVGILTGDVQIKPDASCLVMTTEILRSMLYRGADLIRDVEFVIFDEVHYVNDIERGVVWEEVIIMLPAHITLILLSATVPNTKEFADWVG